MILLCFSYLLYDLLFYIPALHKFQRYPYGGVEPNEPGHDISARMDLNPARPIPNGGIDSKVINNCMLKTMTTQAISGPTHATQPLFRWVADDGKDLWPGFPHIGLPDLWKFDWVQLTPMGAETILDVEAC
jgi:hypothetical protein